MASTESLNAQGLAAEPQGAHESAPGASAPAPAAAHDNSQTADLAAALRAIENRLAALPTSSDLERRIAAVDRALGTINGDPADAPSAGSTSPSNPIGLPSDWAGGLDDAVAEITRRQQALDTSGAAGSGESVRARPAPAELSALHDQLRHLSKELQTLRQPGGFDDTARSLRKELASIGRTLAEAAPERALNALGTQVDTLSHRVDRNRYRSDDASALAGIERGLAEVRDTLAQLKPSESLAGCRQEVRALDRKIEQIIAEGSDGTLLPQVERAIAELREVASRAASGEALIALAEEVQALGAKIDRLSSPTATATLGTDALASLERRFDQLSAELNLRSPGASSGANLASVVETLAAKLEHVELGRDNSPTLDAIANQLNRLTERTETLDRLEGLRDDTLAAAERAARDTAINLINQPAAPPVEVDSIKQDLDAFRQVQAQTDRRTQTTLEAVHDTLEKLVERLAMVETDMRVDTRAAPTDVAPRPFGAMQAPSLVPAHASGDEMGDVRIQAEHAHRLAATAASLGLVASQAERRPIDPSLPADHPLEPGAARVRSAPTAAERISASEAALGGARPVPESDAKSNFIAAARRAAQAAANMPATPDVPEQAKSETSTFGAIAQRLTGRRSLVLGLAILVIAGGVHVVLNMLGSGSAPQPHTTAVAISKQAPPAEPNSSSPAANADLSSAKTLPNTASQASPSTLPAAPANMGSQAEPPRDRGASSEEPAQPAKRNDARSTPTVSPLTIASIQLPVDATGSIGRSTGLNKKRGEPAAPMALSQPAAGARPAAPTTLQAAAAAGNGNAEYELATRYAEGRSVPLNLEEAARWFERAASRDVGPAQYRLGSLYEKGQGVKKDLQQARRLYRAAADKGHGKAMHNLAVLYAEGLDGKPDFRAAGQWFRKAAERGIGDSQYNLAVLHARGLGVDLDLAESYKWFALAAQQGDKDANKKRDEIAARLDQSAMAAVQRAVETFTPEPQPEEAVSVKAPAGGWDNVAAAPPAKPKSASETPRKVGPS